MEKPKYTLLFNMESKDGFTSRGRIFFINTKVAQTAYAELATNGEVPTLRPYSPKADRKYLVDYVKPPKK